MSLARLVERYGSTTAIPADVLELAGFVRYRRRIVSIEKLTERQLAEALHIGELKKETTSAKLDQKVRDAQHIIRDTFQRLPPDYITPEFQDSLLNDVPAWVKKFNEGEAGTFQNLDELSLSAIPHVQFAQQAANYLRRRDLPAYAPDVLNYALGAFHESLSQDSFTMAVTSTFFPKASTNYLLSQQGTLEKRAWSHPTLAQEFAAKYGNPRYCGAGPFKSWAFHRLVLKEDDPTEFWGRRLFTLHDALIAQLGDSEQIHAFADLAYSQECSYAGERLFQEGENGVSISLALADDLPRVVEEFENVRSKKGAAIAFLETDGYYIDADYIHSAGSSFRDLLLAVHTAEFGSPPDPLDKYAYLDNFVKNRSKKKKLARLIQQFPSFKELINAQSSGHHDYCDSLPENKTITARLAELGVDPTVFYKGIPPQEFVIRNGTSVDKEKVRVEQQDLYRQTVRHIFSSGIIHNPQRLEQKINDAFEGDQRFSRSPETSFVDYVSSLNDDDLVARVCRVTAEFVGQKNNVKDTPSAAAAAHHLRDINRFFQGKSVTTEQQAQDSDVYCISLASKNPFTDIDIGNDGGCCIGIYDVEDSDDSDREWTPEALIDFLHGRNDLQPVDENGCYMPFYLKDHATQFVEIYKGKDRIGMSLLFAGQNEAGESCLLVNSIENSDRLKNDPHREIVFGKAVQFIKDYATAAGFKHRVISGHNYNPARHYGHDPISFSVEKIHPWQENFYSDVLDSQGKSTGSWKLL